MWGGGAPWRWLLGTLPAGRGLVTQLGRVQAVGPGGSQPLWGPSLGGPFSLDEWPSSWCLLLSLGASSGTVCPSYVLAGLGFGG